MSKIQASSTSKSRAALTRASSIASRKAGSGSCSVIEVDGVTVSSAYRICWVAISRATS